MVSLSIEFHHSTHPGTFVGRLFEPLCFRHIAPLGSLSMPVGTLINITSPRIQYNQNRGHSAQEGVQTENKLPGTDIEAKN